MKNSLNKIIIWAFIILMVMGIFKLKPLETNILSAFLNKNNNEQSQLLKLSNISANTVNIIIESPTKDELEQTKSELLEGIEQTNLKTNSINIDELTSIYKSNPTCYLSEHKKDLIKRLQYDKLAKECKSELYNPLGIMVQTPEIDPYMFATDYLLSLQQLVPELETNINNSYYTKISLNLTNKKTITSDIKTLLNLQIKLNKNKVSTIYLTGTPLHTFKTSQKSALEINLICIISTLILIALCKLYFNSFKILLPIILSIISGFTIGILTTSAIFGQLHLLAIVFGTTLIGISLDYSFHYIIATQKGLDITKELTSSMLTTVLAFLLLLFSGVELLKQIAILTSAGLLGVYIFIRLFFKKFHFENIKIKPVKTYSNKKLLITTFSIIIIMSFIGLQNLSFSDNIKDFYKPEKELLNSEKLNSEIFSTHQISFLTVKGDSLNSLLEKEETIKAELKKENIASISLSDFIPSLTTQQENQNLIKELYKNDLDNYADFLTTEQIERLKQEFTTPSIEISDIVNRFCLDEKTSYMIVFNNLQENRLKSATQINLAKDISTIIYNTRHRCINLLPYIFLIYFIILAKFYSPKNAFKILLSPVVASVFSISLIGLFQQINVFHLLSILLILGFSLDYSIFLSREGKNSNEAVFISFITSFISFILLSLTSFKLISSMGLVISIGILTSYTLSSLLFCSDETETK